MIQVIYEKAGIIPGFHYLPEQAEMFKKYVSDNEAIFRKKHGFARFLDIHELVNMYSRCSSEQMNSIFLAFNNIYHSANVWEQYREDESAIKELIKELDSSKESPDIDKIQRLQYQRFIEELSSIKKRIA